MAERHRREVTRDFELLILTIERDVEILEFGMPLLRRYLAPRRTVFIAPKACISRLERARIPQEGDLTLVEDEILGGLTPSLVRDLLAARNADPGRAGWYFKQLVIFAYATMPQAADRYLVWDADTLPLREMSFFDEGGRAVFDVTAYFHVAYFETLKNLVGIERRVDYSFISDHMMLEKEIVLALLDRIMGDRVPAGDSLARRALSSISDEGLAGGCGFSEYETYGNFAAVYFPERFITRKSSRTREGSTYFGLPPLSPAVLFALSRRYSWANFERPMEADREIRDRLAAAAHRISGFLWSTMTALLHLRVFASYLKDFRTIMREPTDEAPERRRAWTR
jgi:hypothetical protein